MRYVQCKVCEKVYPGSLKVCPNCKTKTPKSAARIIIALVFIFVGVIGLGTASVNWSDNSSDASGQGAQSHENGIQIGSVTKSEVNYENFQKITTGMTYEEVVEIFGAEGKILSEVDLGMGEEYKTAIYCWYDDTGIANCNVTLQGGKVSAKAQVGLN